MNFPGHGLRRGGSSGGAAGPAAARTGALGSPRARGRGEAGRIWPPRAATPGQKAAPSRPAALVKAFIFPDFPCGGGGRHFFNCSGP